ncbi:MAG: hypothetical protein LBK56_09855 [Gracilibacteraceae bacterium]|jgi:hypothetical protein|nr:hypothetical protein [Gracilibacteraceae bacterium]
MLQLKQKKTWDDKQVREKAAQAFRRDLLGLMGVAFANLLPVYGALYFLSRLTGDRIADSVLQAALSAAAVVILFPLQLGWARYCTLIYLRGAAEFKELLHYYRRHLAGAALMGLAVAVISAAVQQVAALLSSDFIAGVAGREMAAVLSVAFQLGAAVYLTLRLCVSPWIFIENPRRGALRSLERSFALTRGQTKRTLIFFWWAPAALIVILALIALFSAAHNVVSANVTIILGALYFTPRLLLWLSGYAINLMTADRTKN